MCDYSEDHANSSDAQTQKMLTIMEDIVSIVSRCKGCVYGGFVREVVVPTLMGNVINELPKDVDLYFKDAISRDQFVGMCVTTGGYTFLMVNSSMENEERYRASDSTVFTISREAYKVTYDSTTFVLDLIVSELFPVDDFDVNRITYTRVMDKWVKVDDEGMFYMNETFDGLLDAIKKKKATMIPLYSDVILSNKAKFDRIKRIFFDKGWDVYFYDRSYNKRKLDPMTSHGTFCDLMGKPCVVEPTIPVTKTTVKLSIDNLKPPGLTSFVNGLFEQQNELFKQQTKYAAKMEKLSDKANMTNASIKKYFDAIPDGQEVVALNERIKKLEAENATLTAFVTQIRSILH